MVFYLVSRTDDADYDEYDAVVVEAENEVSARAQAVALSSNSFDQRELEITVLNWTGQPRVILGSFNAG